MPVRKTKAQAAKQWTPTCNRFVGFIDIMGFKDMVARNYPRTMYKRMLKIAEVKKSKSDIPFFSEHGVKTFMFSDSIIIFSKDDTNDQRDELLRVVAHYQKALLADSIPYRGAVAYGALTVDDVNSIFFGQPLIDAFQLSEQLELYGVVLHHTAERIAKESSIFSKRIFPYITPIKQGGASTHSMLLPFISNRFFVRLPAETIEGFRSMTSGTLRKYIDNTEKYLNAAYEYYKDKVRIIDPSK